MIDKTCINCNKELKISRYNPNKIYCSKKCSSHYLYIKNSQKILNNKKTYRKIFKDKIGAYHHQYYLKNRERIIEASQLYRKENPTKRSKKDSERYKRNYGLNKNFMIKERIRGSLRKCLRMYTRNGKVFKSSKYGLDYKAIINHLKPFPENIKDYHIDHIRPLSSFNLNDLEQIKLAFAPENHQWLLARENISKGNKYPAGLNVGE